MGCSARAAAESCGDGYSRLGMRLALFDLDHTLVSGDSDQLWCAFLVESGIRPACWRETASEIARRYGPGTISAPDYCAFFAQMMAGLTLAELLPLRRRFLAEVIAPLISDDARELLARHRRAGDLLVITTATNRIVREMTAEALEVDFFLCTELEVVDGTIVGRFSGVANMGTASWRVCASGSPRAGRALGFCGMRRSIRTRSTTCRC